MSGFGTVFYYKDFENQWTTDFQNFHNRGFLFGDGVFETMIFLKNNIRFGQSHESRLLEGCFQLGMDSSTLTTIADIENLISENFGNQQILRVRWNIYRNGAGKYLPEENGISETLQIQGFKMPDSIKNRSYISQKIKVPTSPWSHCKTLNALTYVMANLEKSQTGMDEVILCDQQGFVSECGIANIFWIKGGVYFTPSLQCSCIAGVARNRIIQKLSEAGVEVVEDRFLPDQLLEADQVFTSNVTGVSFLASIAGSVFNTNSNPLLEELFQVV